MARYVLPMTYPPKLEAVFCGVCCQTIRKGEKYCIGDQILIFEWTGKPYYSRWGRRLRVVVTFAYKFQAHEDGIYFCEVWRPWDSATVNMIARADGVKDGKTLCEVLRTLNGIKRFDGQTFQIIVWKPIMLEGGVTC